MTASDTAKTLELTILMPCLNEAETIAVCVTKARRWLEARGVAGEVLVSDNGSTDGSQELARTAGARVTHAPRRGYGAALDHGARDARGRFVIMGDADDSYDFSALDPFLEKLRDGFGLVMGNRFQGGIAPGAMPWKNRWLGNPVLSFIGRLFFRIPIGDFHCGLRGFSLEAFRVMDLHTTGMEFASEMVVKASLRGVRITEVPTTLSPDGRSRPPHLRPWRDGWRHLVFLCMYSPRWLFLVPGLLLLLGGLAGAAWLLPGPRRVGGAVLDIHTLLVCGAAALVGLQCVVFAFFTKVLMIRRGLLPEDRRVDNALSGLLPEAFAGAGVLTFLAGLALLLAATTRWGGASFGPLDPMETMRRVIPAALLLVAGCEMVLARIFLNVLLLPARREPETP